MLAPSEVVHEALECNLAAIALTDHDTVGGIAEAQASAQGTDLEVIPGVEINADGGTGELHILGFYIDPSSSSLRELLEAMREARVSRAREMLVRLHELGVTLSWEEIRELAQGETLGRPHIARALVSRGYVASTEEGFARYVGRQGQAYVARFRPDPSRVIDTIRSAGGVAVLAHPSQSGVTDSIPEYAELGLQGLEVYYPSHSSLDVRKLEEICGRFNLLRTGGSDFHGPGHREGEEIGAVYVPLECATELRLAAGR